MNDPILIRTIGLLLPITALGVLWMWRRADHRLITGALLASLSTVPTLLLLNQLGMHFNWWQFEAQGGLFLGIPVDLFIGWVLLWGAIPAFTFPRLNLVLVIAVMLGIDLILMPAAAPVIQLQSGWWLREALGLSISLLPAQLLARWTANDRHLTNRVTILAFGYIGLSFWVLPNLILELTGGDWRSFIERPLWINSIGMQLLALPAVLGLSAVQEFAVRGGGTPIPFDPPKRLVTSGVYAYLANPMQLSTSFALFGWGILLESLWVASAGVMALIFGFGMAAWSAGEDLKRTLWGSLDALS